MVDVEIYTRKFCGYCSAARDLLSRKGIAFREYDDPAQWRRIAEANGIDDPLALQPGRRLLIPPILK